MSQKDLKRDTPNVIGNIGSVQRENISLNERKYLKELRHLVYEWRVLWNKGNIFLLLFFLTKIVNGLDSRSKDAVS